MYKSPIDLIYKEMELQMEKCAKQLDEDIYKAIMQYDIIVDKEELLRALQYDRNQYQKGYADGKADAMAEVIRCKDCKCAYINSFSAGSGVAVCKKWSNEAEIAVVQQDDFCSYGERRAEDGK